MNTQTTPLTMICESEVTYPSVDNQTCNVTLNYIFDPLWETQLTMTYSEKRLKEDLHVGPASLKAGATVNLRLRGDLMFVIFNGVITESGNINNLSDIQIGVFRLPFLEKPILLPGN
jgi:hypothetical protein